MKDSIITKDFLASLIIERLRTAMPVDESRNCVSNYYFSPQPLRDSDRFHVTTFRGWPQQRIKNEILKLDSTLRTGLRRLFKKGVIENPHVYKKDKE
jgi:hypothetical protein